MSDAGGKFIRHPDDRDRGEQRPGAQIARLWAVLNVDPTGAEGITCVYAEDGRPIPLISASRETIEASWRMAQEIHRQSGRPLRLVCFSVREVLEEIGRGVSQ